jgi:hypothetical protein
MDKGFSKKTEFFYHSIVEEADTLILESFISIYGLEGKDSLSRLKKYNLFFNSLHEYKFKYDEIPQKLKAAIGSNRKIDAFRNEKGNWFFLTSSDEGAKRQINFKLKETDSIISISLEYNLRSPNFFLFDILEDEMPEIFICTPVYFMNNDLIELSIYKIDIRRHI